MPTVFQLEALLGNSPEDVFLNFGLAMALAKESRMEEALARFDRVLELDPAYIAAFFQKARVQAEYGRPDEAVATLRHGIAAAESAGDGHAAQEMAEYAATLGDV